MFSITEDAEIYVKELFEQQDEKDLGLKVDVEKAGTPVATVTFNFCLSNDLPESYNEYPYKGFSAYIDDSNDEYLKGLQSCDENRWCDQKAHHHCAEC